eukprot:6188173-Pleurochrysis_carterae.AAC.1
MVFAAPATNLGVGVEHAFAIEFVELDACTLVVNVDVVSQVFLPALGCIARHLSLRASTAASKPETSSSPWSGHMFSKGTGRVVAFRSVTIIAGLCVNPHMFALVLRSDLGCGQDGGDRFGHRSILSDARSARVGGHAADTESRALRTGSELDAVASGVISEESVADRSVASVASVGCERGCSFALCVERCAALALRAIPVPMRTTAVTALAVALVVFTLRFCALRVALRVNAGLLRFVERLRLVRAITREESAAFGPRDPTQGCVGRLVQRSKRHEWLEFESMGQITGCGLQLEFDLQH